MHRYLLPATSAALALWLSACALSPGAPEPTAVPTGAEVLPKDATMATSPPGARGLGSGRLVDVGGYRLYIRCVGEGSPTVVMEAGLDSDSSVWGPVQERVGSFTRACSYDRAGTGRSDPGPLHPSSETHIRDLHALLETVGIRGPRVLAGQAYGGYTVRLYADRYPLEVVGMVLVDAWHPDMWGRLSGALPPESPDDPLGLRSLRAFLADPSESGDADVEGSAMQVRAVDPPVGWPLVVLSGTAPRETPPNIPDDVARRLGQEWRQMQAELARLSPNSAYVAAGEGTRDVLRDEPQLVNRSIYRVVQASTAILGSPCGGASPRTASYGPTC